MADTTSSVTSDAVLRSSSVSCRPERSNRPASAGTHGADPMTPALKASHSSGVKYHHTVYIVGAAELRPVIAFRNAIAPVNVSARKKTQPIITTAIVYACAQIGHDAGPRLTAELAELAEKMFVLRVSRVSRLLFVTRSATRNAPCHRPQ